MVHKSNSSAVVVCLTKLNDSVFDNDLKLTTITSALIDLKLKRIINESVFFVVNIKINLPLLDISKLKKTE